MSALSTDSPLGEFARLPSLLHTRAYGRSFDFREETGSTNDDAKEAADQGAARGHVVLAESQTRGRGSRGRAWSSPPKTDLYLSIVEQAGLPPRIVPTLTLAVGLGVRDACASLLGIVKRVQVKWPNDVWIEGRKAAGILVEASSVGSVMGSIIIGIGLDVNRAEWSDELRPIATSLADAGERVWGRCEVLATLLACVEARVDAHIADGPEVTVSALREHLAMVGEKVCVEKCCGVLLGLNAEGALLLEVDGRAVAVHAGTLRRA